MPCDVYSVGCTYPMKVLGKLILLLVKTFQPLVENLEILLQARPLVGKSGILEGFLQLHLVVVHLDGVVEGRQRLQRGILQRLKKGGGGHMSNKFRQQSLESFSPSSHGVFQTCFRL